MEVGNAQAQAQRRGSMHAVLGSLLLEVPRALLEPDARVDLLLAAERLPNALSRRNVGLELRLQGPPPGATCSWRRGRPRPMDSSCAIRWSTFPVARRGPG
jgi:hypothetical protein